MKFKETCQESVVNVIQNIPIGTVFRDAQNRSRLLMRVSYLQSTEIYVLDLLTGGFHAYAKNTAIGEVLPNATVVVNP